jgi:hypothetical protein
VHCQHLLVSGWTTSCCQHLITLLSPYRSAPTVIGCSPVPTAWLKPPRHAFNSVKAQNTMYFPPYGHFRETNLTAGPQRDAHGIGDLVDAVLQPRARVVVEDNCL